MRMGELGFWWASMGGPPPARDPLQASTEADVAIVGAGFTGLWTAYYLKRADPSLRVLVLEAQTAGFGASGRNGGWLSGFFSGPPAAYGPGYGSLQRAMFATVREVASVVQAHGIECDLLGAGHLEVAVGEAQRRRLGEHMAAAREHGLDEHDLRWIEAGELHERVRVAGARGATFTPHVARVNPVKLVLGLARAVEELGVAIHERTPVSAIEAHRALTSAGHAVKARWVVRATEGYTPSLAGQRRALAPINSSMIVTEPLDESAWRAIGWSGAELIADAAHVYVYLQRTADGRIAIGGRGVPYRFASRTDGRGETAPATVASLQAKLAALFPAAAGARVEHAWSGVLGAPRDWCISAAADPERGLARAGGYVGEGIAAANLAGRTLTDLILDRPGELTGLPWVGRTPRRWEPEPLRWAGIRAVYALYRAADRIERRTGKPSRLGALVDAVSGRA